MIQRNLSRLSDVARLAGVSIPTASQALNGHARISAETRRRVREAARQLRYTPHAAARRLILGRSNSIAIVPGTNLTGLFSDLFYRALLSGVGGVFEETGFRMLITPAIRSATEVPQFIQMARGREVDGVLVAGVVEAAWINAVTVTGMPVVLLDNHDPELSVLAVVNDNAQGAYSATRYLTALGHTRIGLIGAAVTYPFGPETRAGYRRALRDAGLPVDPNLEVSSPIDVDRARASTGRLLTLPNPPSAIFAVTDAMALGVIKAAHDRGWSIPGDLSVVGMDDIELASATSPPLTTVRIRKEEMGQKAAQALIRVIAGQEPGPSPIVLSNELVVRGTTGRKR